LLIRRVSPEWRSDYHYASAVLDGLIAKTDYAIKPYLVSLEFEYWPRGAAEELDARSAGG